MALGLTFNYLVSLFNSPIRPAAAWPVRLYSTSPSSGNLGGSGWWRWLLGLFVAVVSLVLGVAGWEVERIWLYLLGGAMFLLIGVQLIIYWILMRVLEELSQREETVEREILKAEQAAAPETAIPAIPAARS